MARALIVIVALASAARVLAVLPRLPYPVAVHFDAAGTPNGWMLPPAFAAFHLVLLALLVAVLGYTAVWLVALWRAFGAAR
jgi:uncharacterized membrane protein